MVNSTLSPGIGLNFFSMYAFVSGFIEVKVYTVQIVGMSYSGQKLKSRAFTLVVDRAVVAWLAWMGSFDKRNQVSLAPSLAWASSTFPEKHDQTGVL